MLLPLEKKPTLVLKLDFAKAFDSVNWDSLLLQSRGFHPLWLKWMTQILATSRSAFVLTVALVPGLPADADSGKAMPCRPTSSYSWLTCFNA